MVIWQVMVLTHDKVLLAEVPYLRWNLKENNTKPSQELENWNLVQGGTQPQIGLGQSVGRNIYTVNCLKLLDSMSFFGDTFRGILRDCP